MVFLKEDWVLKVESGFHGSSYVFKDAHIKFQAFHHKFAQSIAQMTENQLYWVKGQLWSIDSQTSEFFDKIQHFEVISSIDQMLITIPQEKHSNHQRGKIVKIRVLIEND